MSLYPKLFKGMILPILDVPNRTRVAQIHRGLEASQWWSAERLEELQQRKLETILDFTEQRSSFYRDYWRRAPESQRASSKWRRLDGLPVVSKQDLRSGLEQFPLAGWHLGKPWKKRLIATKTSGSTGQPMTYLRSGEQESWFWALRFRMWQWGGYVPGEPYLTLNLNARKSKVKKLQDVVFKCSYHGFNANQGDVDAVLRDLEGKGVRHLVGYATSLFLLAQAMAKRGIANPGVRSILSTGDSLLPTYRRRIEEVFGVGVVDYYGAGGEGFHLASQCEERGLYHLHPENAVIELLRDGRPARPGELGEIVVTQLDNRAMPLVRYGTQDVAVMAEAGATCPCGRQMPLIKGVQGRVPDIVMAPDGSALVVHFFTILFEYLEGIEQFQIVQDEPDRIVASIVRRPDYDAAKVEEKVRHDVAEVTRGTLGVDFHYPDHIPTAQSNKRRLVISNLRDTPLSVSAPENERLVEAPRATGGD